MRSIKRILAIASLAILAACGAPKIQNVQVGDVQVREVPVGGANTNTPDGKLSLFVFIPVIDRPFETRISIAEQYLAGKGCRLGTTNRNTLLTLTRGAGAANQVLMAPIKC